MMKCEISIDDKKLEKFVGRKMTKKEFADFCLSAIASKLWEQQILKNTYRKSASQTVRFF